MVHASDEVSGLADAELVGRLEQLVRTDRALSAKLLVHLGEVDARKLYCERSFSSMFEYCRSGLGMSEAEAGLRILAARTGRRFPLILERLGAGAVHLSAIKLLAPHLTADNHVQLLDRTCGMSKRQVEVLVADLAPKPDVPARMRKLPEKRNVVESNTAATIAAPGSAAVMPIGSNTAGTTAAPCGASLTSAPAASPQPLSAAFASSTTAQPPAAWATSSTSSSTFALHSPQARASSTPLGRGRFALRLTLGQEAHVALEQLVELFRHQNPSGDFTNIVERALIELRKREMKRRFGQTNATDKRAASVRLPCDAIQQVVTSEPAPADATQQFVTSEPARAGAAQQLVTSEPARAGAAQQLVTSEQLPADATQQLVTCEPAPADATTHPLTRERAPAKREIAAKTKREVSLSKSRYIPRPVLREVYARDSGQCTYVSPEGRRCTSRGFLQVHHHNTTFGRGGEATAENLRLTCRAHNLFHAERDYGRAFMQQKLREARERNMFQVPGTDQS